MPKTINQKRYIEAIRSSDIVFGIGPAGTGKTWLAVAMAVSALAHEQVSRIILTIPDRQPRPGPARGRLRRRGPPRRGRGRLRPGHPPGHPLGHYEIGRASCRERV